MSECTYLFSTTGCQSVCVGTYHRPDEVWRAIAQKQAVVCLCLWVGGCGWGFLGLMGVVEGGVASIPGRMVKSAAQQKCIPRWGESCMGSTTIRFFGWAAGLAPSELNGRKRGESV